MKIIITMTLMCSLVGLQANSEQRLQCVVNMEDVVKSNTDAVYFATIWATKEGYLEPKDGVLPKPPVVQDKGKYYSVIYPANIIEGERGSDYILSLKVKKLDGEVYDPIVG